MTTEHDTLLKRALALSLEDRASLIQHLIASLDGVPDEDGEAAWGDEIERRARRVLSGKSVGRPWEEVRKRLEAQLESNA